LSFLLGNVDENDSGRKEFCNVEKVSASYELMSKESRGIVTTSILCGRKSNSDWKWMVFIRTVSCFTWLWTAAFHVVAVL